MVSEIHTPDANPDFKVWRMSSLVAILLALPLIMDITHLTDRRAGFMSVFRKEPSYPFLYQEIYEKTSDLDAVFMGSSLLLVGLDTSYLRARFSSKLGRPAEVITLGYSYSGLDFSALLLKELAQRRKVKTVFLLLPQDNGVDQEGPHQNASYYLQYRDLAFLSEGLTWADRLRYFTIAVVSAPRQLWWHWHHGDAVHGTKIEEHFGNVPEKLGIDLLPDSFEVFEPEPPHLSAEELIYSKASPSRFHFETRKLASFDEVMVQKFFKVAKDYGIKVAVVSVPTIIQVRQDFVYQRLYWPDFLAEPVPMIGVVPREIFKAWDQKSIEKFYYGDHLNQNGSRYFTRAIAPGFEKVFTDFLGRKTP